MPTTQLPPLARDTIALLTTASRLTNHSKSIILSEERIFAVTPIRYAIFAILQERHPINDIATALKRRRPQILHGIRQHQKLLSTLPNHAQFTQSLRVSLPPATSPPEN